MLSFTFVAISPRDERDSWPRGDQRGQATLRADPRRVRCALASISRAFNGRAQRPRGAVDPLLGNRPTKLARCNFSDAAKVKLTNPNLMHGIFACIQIFFPLHQQFNPPIFFLITLHILNIIFCYIIVCIECHAWPYAPFPFV